MIKISYRLKSPIAVQIEVTENCNYLCSHCYNYWRYDSPTDKKNGSNLEKIVEAVIDADVFHIVFTGGEPLLKYEELLKAIKTARSNNLSVSLNTNLSLMNSEKAKTLKNAGLKNILTSIYSYDESVNNDQMNNKNAFQHTLRGIEHAMNSGILVSVNMVVNKRNSYQVYKTGNYLKSKGVYSFNATRFCPVVPCQTEELLDFKDIVSMLEQLKTLSDEGLKVGTLNPIPHCFSNGEYVELTQRRGCSAGTTSAGISVNGDVRACQHTSKSYGNILSEKLETIWEKIPIWKNCYLPEECKGCSSINNCGGGCRHTANVVYGSFNEKDPLYSGQVKTKHEKHEHTKINTSEKLELEPGLHRRKESFGGVIYRDLQHFTLVDNALYSIMPSLAKETFTISEIEKSTGISANHLTKQFSHMIDRELIKTQGGQKNG